MKSSAEEQRILIELQDLDLQIARLDHQAKTLPVLKELAQATEGFESHDALAVASATEKSDIEVEFRRSEADVEQVTARITKDQHYVDSGQASAKDLQNLLGELESLKRRKQELEEVELEIMVRIDDVESRRKHHDSERARFSSEVERLTADRDLALAEIDSKRSEVVRERDGKAVAVSKELLDLYLKIKDSNGGIGAARLKDGQCEGCHLSINAVELTRIKSLPDDELVRCEE
ncbi:MAG: zinc ribbon domain-containing protein [Actinomycetota bacterium]